MKIVVNGVLMTEATQLSYIANPKRIGSAAYERYEAYKSVQTVGEYFAIASEKHGKADLRWDHDKKFCVVADAE